MEHNKIKANIILVLNWLKQLTKVELTYYIGISILFVPAWCVIVLVPTLGLSGSYNFFLLAILSIPLVLAISVLQYKSKISYIIVALIFLYSISILLRQVYWSYQLIQEYGDRAHMICSCDPKVDIAGYIRVILLSTFALFLMSRPIMRKVFFGKK